LIAVTTVAIDGQPLSRKTAAALMYRLLMMRCLDLGLGRPGFRKECPDISAALLRRA